MKKYLTAFCLMLASLFGTSHAIAQHENEIEEVAESIEAIAEQLGNAVGEIGEQIEIVMDENSDELEEWAAKYESQWEEWAESLESRLESWAEEQEQVWEEWAEKYSQKWESWAEELDGGDMEPEQVNRMIRRNLQMLGDMPLGELVEGLMKEGTKGFESAPWESLSDLQSMFQESIERTVKETERRVAEAQENSTKHKRGRVVGTDSEELDYILPVIEQQQAGLKAKEKALASEAESIFNQIRDKLSSGKANKADITELMKLIEKQDAHKAKAKASIETAKALAKAKAKLKNQAKTVENARKRNRELQQRTSEQRRRVEQARREAEKRLSQSLERVRDRQQTDDSGESDQKTQQMLRVLDVLEGEEKKLQDKNRELELLRKEVQQLRREIEKMAKNRDDK